MADLLEKFRRIAEERLQHLSRLLLQVEGSRDGEVLRELLRELHTLKGEAGVLGLHPMTGVAHALEDLLGGVETGALEPSAGVFDLGLEALDTLLGLVEGREIPDEAREALIERLREASGAATGGRVQAQVAAFEAAVAALKGSSAAEARPSGAAEPETRPAPTLAAPSEERGGRIRWLSVDPERLERLSELAGDLLIARERSAARMDELRELLERARQELTGAPEWLRGLEEVARGTSHDLLAQSRSLNQLGEQLRELRLAPVESSLEGYRRAARDLARAQGKQVRLDVEAQAVEIDQTLLDALREPLLHIVRNAVAHGLEPPAQREAAGKSPVGRLSISVEPVGSAVEVTVEDDGRGIDRRALAEAARGCGLLADAAEPDDEELLQLVFHPGISTSLQADEVSGRGVGLHAARRRLAEHRGTIRVQSDPGHGTQFTLSLPLEVSLSRALICEARGQRYAIAVEDVLRVMSVEAGAIRPLGPRRGLFVDERTVPLCSLSSLLPGGAQGPPEPGARVVLARTVSGPLAIVPDRIVGQREVVYRSLDAFLSSLPTLRSSCVLPDGSVALLLDLEQVAGSEAGVSRVPLPARREDRRLRVFVVEDSAITRDLIAEIVRSAGYEAVPCSDGQEALERLSQEPPDLVLTDLEMPRLDGVGLTRRLRELMPRRVPVVVITTRGSEVERRACLEAGADAFLDKSKFKEGALIETMRRLVGQ